MLDLCQIGPTRVNSMIGNRNMDWQKQTYKISFTVEFLLDLGTDSFSSYLDICEMCSSIVKKGTLSIKCFMNQQKPIG